MFSRLISVGVICATFATAAFSQTVQVTLTDGEGQPLENAVIELLLPDSQKSQYQQATNSLIDQRNKEFVPTVTTVTVGSQVNFPNSDDILHHVYSFSPAKTFNIPLYGQGENDDYFETFTEPGIVEIGCNIHDWMLAYLYVAETSLVSLSDSNGVASIANAPSGEYSLRIWHPRAAANIEELTQSVVLSSGAVTELSMSLELRRDRRVRRAPGSDGRRYR
ncbi:MAG: methylamine utilization protein [Pseudomonadales bacterium]|nr:methylamine utilization protein [Pseudomonadales bacterium]